MLEKFPNPAVEGSGELSIDIEAPEFSCLCPITGQPDTATIKVTYQPRAFCVESKAFKLYLVGFRNHGTFHEAVVTDIARDLIALLDPEYLRVDGEFAARGGIPFRPSYTYHRCQSLLDETIDDTIDLSN